jgi:hypothetical protein
MPGKLPDWHTWSHYRREHLGIPDAVARGERLQRWIELVKRSRKTLDNTVECGILEMRPHLTAEDT